MSNRNIKTLKIVPELVQIVIIDGLCGAGGFTEGAEQSADENGNRLAIVAAGVNHDELALKSHEINHPETVHFREDIRDKTLPYRILAVVEKAKKLYPNAIILFHCSLECTNFSNAKGGKPRDADSRSLAEYMPTYLEVLNPDVFTVENVREFMSWGPLDLHGKPISRQRGRDYVKWYQSIEAMGYRYDYRLHNTADYGANTSRTRYFAQFVKPGIPLVWPEPTHAKNPDKNLFSKPLQKWKPIRECLELDDKGTSIFREKPLSDKTYERIFEGLIRHVGNGDRAFLSKYFTGSGMNYPLGDTAHTITNVDHHSLISVQPFMARLFATASNGHGTYKSDQPATTITTADGHAIVTPEPFAMSYYSGSPENRVKSMDDPAQTVTTCNRIALVSAETFCMKYHGSGENTFDVEKPCSTLTTNDRVGVVSTEQFVSLYYSSGKQDQSIDSPGSALTIIPKHCLVSARFIDQQYGQSKPSSVSDPAPCLTVNPHCALVEAFIVDPQWGGHSRAIDQPGNTIIARQDKAPVSLVSAEFITQRNGGEPECRNTSLDDPAKTVTTTGGNMELVQSEWLLTNIHNNVGTSLDEPGPTLLTGTHHYVMNVETGAFHPVILVYATDSLIIRKIKAFMAEYGIVDILMRMLKVQELKRIQGFPENYVLLGSQTNQKKFIGNSIPPPYVKAWMEAVGFAVRELKGGVAA